MSISASPASAQANGSSDGAIFLLLPVGARATAMGQAAITSNVGMESAWWNPAALTSITAVTGAIHHSESLIGTGDAFALAVPFSLLGVISISASTINFGEQELSESPGGPIGLLVPRSLVFAATFASELTPVVRVGLTYKLVQMRADCSGACQSVESLRGETSALDFGVQVVPADDHPVSYAFAIRNVGPRLQVVDTEQADALPARVHLGLSYRVVPFSAAVEDAELVVAIEGVDRLQVQDPVVRLGAELAYQKRLFLRGGYTGEKGSGGSIGGGIVAGKLTIDIARVLGGLSADLGEPPTHISLSYRFR